MATLSVLLLVTNLLLFFSKISSAKDTITKSESLPDNTTLVSNNGTFELGFFTPGSSTNHYLGIWYKGIPDKTVVWVANRDNPIKDNSSMLSITSEGNLMILNKNNTVVWSTNATTKSVNVVLQLLDSGNLVLRDEKDNNPENYLWQSFDYPSDTLLSGMKVGWDFKKGLNRRLIAWKNWDDPSSGDFIADIELTNNPEAVMWKGSTKYYRSGPWNGLQFSGDPSVTNSLLANYMYVSNKDEMYISYTLIDKSVISRIVMNQTLSLRQRLTWDKVSQTWKVSSQLPSDLCDYYNNCGPFGICVIGNAPVCKCLDGFKPKSLQNWTQMNWNQGCVHNQTWRCGDKEKDGFHKFSNVKAPDTERSWVNASMTLDECKDKCWGNCSCTAFGNSDIREGGSGCAIWFGDLLDLRLIANAGQDLYIRLAVPEIGMCFDFYFITLEFKRQLPDWKIIFLVQIVCVKTEIITRITKKNNETEQEDLELPLFDLATIAHATNHFSDHNKLGEGGFGPVYRDPSYLIAEISAMGESYYENLTSYSVNDVTISMLTDR
ncbi:hypothetical protein VNO77_37205 [Canavalia gladiata]|uniref:Uncharacterized protein n=1 Tax=Canavalia gladiata TaxID=3824 RepID=A0AAN9KB84_CANGL